MLATACKILLINKLSIAGHGRMNSKEPVSGPMLQRR